jgi:hypothetical protein
MRVVVSCLMLAVLALTSCSAAGFGDDRARGGTSILDLSGRGGERPLSPAELYFYHVENDAPTLNVYNQTFVKTIDLGWSAVFGNVSLTDDDGDMRAIVGSLPRGGRLDPRGFTLRLNASEGVSRQLQNDSAALLARRYPSAGGGYFCSPRPLRWRPRDAR